MLIFYGIIFLSKIKFSFEKELNNEEFSQFSIISY